MEKQIGQKLRELRISHGLKPMNVSLSLNIDESTIYKIEGGTLKSWGKYIFALLELYGKPMGDFFNEVCGGNYVHIQENKDQATEQVNGGTINYSDKPMVKSLFNQKDKTIELLEEKVNMRDEKIEEQARTIILQSEKITHLEAELTKVSAKI